MNTLFMCPDLIKYATHINMYINDLYSVVPAKMDRVSTRKYLYGIYQHFILKMLQNGDNLFMLCPANLGLFFFPILGIVIKDFVQ